MLFYNQLKLSSYIGAYIGSVTDSLSAQLQDTLNVVLANAQGKTFCGLSLEWGSIIIPTIASIVVFVIGIAIERLNKARENKKETITFRNTLFRWIDLVKQPVKNQIRILNCFAEAIKNNKTLQNERLAFPRNMVKKINIATAENVIKYLINNSSKPSNDERPFHAFNLISQIDYLQSLEADIISLYDSYQKESMALFDDWNSNIQKIQRLSAGMYTSAEAEVVSDLNVIIDAWKTESQNDTEVDIQETYNLLIIPILERLKSHLFKMDGYAEVDGIKESTLALSYVYSKWCSIKYFAKCFHDYADHANTSLSYMTDAMNYFLTNTRAIK